MGKTWAILSKNEAGNLPSKNIFMGGSEFIAELKEALGSKTRDKEIPKAQRLAWRTTLTELLDGCKKKRLLIS